MTTINLPVNPPCLALDSIRSDIPVPDRRPRTDRRYPRINEALRTMKPGDSCLIERCDRPGLYHRATVLKIRIRTQKEGPDHFRVWKLPA